MDYEPGMITLVLPCYNESENVVYVLSESIVELEKLGRPWELIVIDNNSSDGTPNVVREFMGNHPRVRMVIHPENRLYSGSCLTAMREARGEFVAIMDSDGQFSARDIRKMLERIETGANLVFGWRKPRHDPILRKIVSLVFNVLGKVWLGFPLHDLNCGIRMFDRKFANVAEIRYRINMANPEFFVRAWNAGLKVEEIVITHSERRKGRTSHNLRKMYSIFVEVNHYFRGLHSEMHR
jgi:glycosyltransferase involved in cell wall biosynthesis